MSVHTMITILQKNLFDVLKLQTILLNLLKTNYMTIEKSKNITDRVPTVRIESGDNERLRSRSKVHPMLATRFIVWDGRTATEGGRVRSAAGQRASRHTRAATHAGNMLEGRGGGVIGLKADGTWLTI